VVQNDQQTQAAAPVVVKSNQQAQAAAPAVAQNDQQPQTADSNADPATDPEEGTGVPTTSTKADSSNGAQPTSTDAQPTDSNETTSKASIAPADNPTISADSAETVNATEGTPKAKPTVPCTPAPATTALVLDIPKAPKIKRKRSLESIDEENPDPKRRTRTTRKAAQDELPQPPKKRARKAAEKVGTTAKATRATSKSVSVAPATPLQAAERARPTASARARKVADYATRAPSKAKRTSKKDGSNPAKDKAKGFPSSFEDPPATIVFLYSNTASTISYPSVFPLLHLLPVIYFCWSYLFTLKRQTKDELTRLKRLIMALRRNVGSITD
jgi:hypothetical protein